MLNLLLLFWLTIFTHLSEFTRGSNVSKIVLSKLVGSWVEKLIFLSSSIFYVRNHLPVPEVDTSNYRIEITGIGVKSTCLTLDQIKKFPKKTISATIQCAGNRRSEMSKVKHVKGLSWNQAAIGNATWSGAKLIDVLKSCGVDVNREDILHVQFEALDKGPDNVPYGASVPADIALNPKGDVILAYEMNGEPLPRDHGFPIRIIVPGVVGARNVKWVSKIVLSDEESHSHWQRGDYKGFSPSVDWDTVDFKSAPAIQELPVISAICVPSDGDKVEPFDGSILVKGKICYKQNSNYNIFKKIFLIKTQILHIKSLVKKDTF